MAGEKLYGDGYEAKLRRVMARLGVDDFDYNWTRTETYIAFVYRGQHYRFEHSLDKARRSGQKIVYVSDCFAQLVQSLEDIARMTERGIYELSAWIEGMKALPPPKPALESCFIALGFDTRPETTEDVERQYRRMAKVMHPDAGGSEAAFIALRGNYTAALALVQETKDE